MRQLNPKEAHGEDFLGKTFRVLKEKEVMATYKQIQAWVKQNYGFVPKTCWIADVKSQSGLPMRKAPNRKGTERVESCPPEKGETIREALKHFRMIR